MFLQTKLRYCIPSGITFLRLIAAPFFYYCVLSSWHTAALGILLAAVVTDIIDGISARYLAAVSRFGAYADAVSDFVFVTTAFAAFVKIGWYYSWVPVPIVLSFFTFLLTSRNKILVYDPVGKYMGAIMMGIIACTLVLPFHILRIVFTYSLLIIVIVNIFFRVRSIKQ